VITATREKQKKIPSERQKKDVASTALRRKGMMIHS
jgi:hypothetical protein